MQYLKLSGGTGDEAVSPVVGVMLMLIVTIIIAAVVSGFAGGLIGNAGQKVPTLAMDVKVINMGSWTGSGFFATVTSVSKPIPTSNLKIVTSWTAANGTMPVSGGSTVLPGPQGADPLNGLYGSPYLNTNCLIGGNGNGAYSWIAPWGGGPGINGSVTIGYTNTNPSTFGDTDQQFGEYTLVPGTTLTAKPVGQSTGQAIGGSAGSSGSGYGTSTPYTYSSSCTDATMAVFGSGWQYLQEGDTVNIKVIYTPTGSVIFNKNVPVTEG